MQSGEHDVGDDGGRVAMTRGEEFMALDCVEVEKFEIEC